MGKIVDNNQINPHLCDFEDLKSNWQILVPLITEMQATIVEGGAGDTYKVAVNATHAAATPVYLHAALNDAGTFGDTCLLVKAETISDATEKLFADFSTLDGYASDLDFYVMVRQGVLELISSADVTASDNFTVKVTGTDTTPDFLINKMELVNAYVSGADLLVGSNTVGGAGTDQSLKNFVDVSAIQDHNTSGFFVLCCDNNTSKWVGVTTLIGGNLTAGTYIDISGSTISVDLTEIADYSGSATQLPGHEAGTFTMKTQEDWLKEVSGYDAGESQTLKNTTGTVAWGEAASSGGSAKIGKADSTIAARSDNTAGSGTVSIWSISGTTLSDTGENETWYNIADSPVASGVFLQAKADATSGQMIIDYELC